MTKKGSNKKIKVSNMKSSDIAVIQRKASPVKIAYYVQRMLEKKVGTKEIILIISDQFGNDDIREFAKMYKYCFYIEDIRHIANLIYHIPKKDMNESMDTVFHDVLIKKEILPSEYIRALEQKSLEQKSLEKKRDV